MGFLHSLGYIVQKILLALLVISLLSLLVLSIPGVMKYTESWVFNFVISLIQALITFFIMKGGEK